MERIEGTDAQQQEFEQNVSRYERASRALSWEPDPIDYEPETYDKVRERLSDHVEADLMTVDEANEIMNEYIRMYGW